MPVQEKQSYTKELFKKNTFYKSAESCCFLILAVTDTASKKKQHQRDKLLDELRDNCLILPIAIRDWYISKESCKNSKEAVDLLYRVILLAYKSEYLLFYSLLCGYISRSAYMKLSCDMLHIIHEAIDQIIRTEMEEKEKKSEKSGKSKKSQRRKKRAGK